MSEAEGLELSRVLDWSLVKGTYLEHGTIGNKKVVLHDVPRRTTTETPCRTALNNGVNKGHNDTARAKYSPVSFFAVHCKTTT